LKLAPFDASLCRGLRLVNSQLLVTGASLGRRASARGKIKYPQDSNAVVEREGDDASGAHFLGRLLDALAVDPDVALFDDALGEGAALHQPDEEQETVDPHVFLSFASSAKA